MKKNLLLTVVSLLLASTSFSQVTGILPNTAQLGESNLLTTITGNNIFFTTATPSGNLSYVILSKPGYTIYDQIPYQLYINNNTVVTRFTIPSQAGYLGTYNTSVYTWSGNYSLPSSFNVLPITNYVSGKVYHDANQNGIYDTGELTLPNQHIKLNPGNVSIYTDNSGNYLIPTQVAVFTVQWISYGSMILTSDSASFTLNVNGAMTGYDFGIASSYPDYVSQVTFSSGAPRCNTTVHYYLSYKNLGNVPYNATAYIMKDTAVSFVSSVPAPSSVNGDTIFFTITNVLPFVMGSIYADFQLPGPGDTILMKSNFTALNATGGVGFSQDNQLSQIVLCSYDPNDKAVTPPGVYGQHYTLFTDTLEYLIRFQNTGNAPAFKVVIRDILDPNLDLSTFHIVANSHNMITTLTPDRQLTFTFNNINLPDSNANEPGSHGWIKYRILANAGIPYGTIISNTALIYFDSNLPVVTNTTFNTMVPVIPVDIGENLVDKNDITVVPNPMSDIGHLFFKNPGNELMFLKIIDARGKVVFQDMTQTGHFEISKKGISAGIYFYVITNKKRNILRGKFAVN